MSSPDRDYTTLKVVLWAIPLVIAWCIASEYFLGG